MVPPASRAAPRGRPLVVHATWRSGALALWAGDGERSASPLDLERLVRLGITHELLWAARPDTIEIGLPAGGQRVAALVLGAHHAGEALLLRSSTRGWSPSLRWMRAAAALASSAVATGRVLPALDARGLQWLAHWVVVDDGELDIALDALAAALPDVVRAPGGTSRGAGSGADAAELARDVVAALADGLARRALETTRWRPPLAGSRTAASVGVRRVAEALANADGVVVGANARHEEVFARTAVALADARTVAEGGVPVDVQARLYAPEDPDEPWPFVLEVVRRDDPSVPVPAAAVWAHDTEALDVLGPGGFGPARRRLRTAVARVSAAVPALAALGVTPVPSAIELDLAGAAGVLAGLDAAERAGLPVLVPTGLVKRRAGLKASATTVEGGGPSAGLGGRLVDVDWDLVLGDERLDERELAALAAAKTPLVQVRGQWVRLDPAQVETALANLVRNRAEKAQLTATELLRTALELHETGDDLDASGWLGDLLAGLPDDRLAESAEPDGFDGTLRHYQRRGLGWMQFLGRLGLGGCLADDMGLGKTPTTLAHLVARREAAAAAGRAIGPTLVLCPLSVVRTWQSEAARFAPELRTLVVHGGDRVRGSRLQAVAAAHDLVVTTYATATRDVDDLAAVAWDVVVCDEAQAIKNHHTAAAKAVRRLRAEQVLALTGTPVENRLAELWAILDAVNPGMLGGVTWFRERYATPIESHGDERALDGLKRLTRPFVLRRTKADRSLVPDLPDKVESIAWSTLTREQASLYKAVVDDFEHQLGEVGGMARRGLVLATLTKLKQICNHPAHFLGDGSRLGGRSGKLTRFDELVDELLDAGERALVFTQYREMGALLVAHLQERRGLAVPFLHGGVAKSKRDAMVERFQDGEVPLQLISLKAGGTGLTLTAASRVIHYDRWWNPAVENQATDRAWRIGQVSTVFVHKLVCQGTLEERIDALITQKQALADLVVGSGEGWLTELSTDDLRALVRLDQREAEGR